MKSFTNDVINNWRVELDQDSTLRQFMPMLNFTLDNSGDSEVNVFLHGESVGSCYGYATLSVMGKPFESFRIEGVFNIGDLTVNVSKMETVTAMPFNPQIDLMEENLDKFASGTDNRISYSSTVGADSIKYWINVQNGLIVQRKLDVLGGASVGSYEISFNGDIVSGSTAINFPSVDLKRYKKTISNSSFDYTVTNCSISGWLIDYFKNPDDLSTNYTVVTGGATAPNAYDDDLSTRADYSALFDGSKTTYWEVSFPAKDIDEIHSYYELDGVGGGTNCLIYLDAYYGGAWHTVDSQSNATTDHEKKYVHKTALGLTDVTKIRYQAYSDGASGTRDFNIYDISAFPTV